MGKGMSLKFAMVDSGVEVATRFVCWEGRAAGGGGGCLRTRKRT